MKKLILSAMLMGLLAGTSFAQHARGGSSNARTGPRLISPDARMSPDGRMGPRIVGPDAMSPAAAARVRMDAPIAPNASIAPTQTLILQKRRRSPQMQRPFRMRRELRLMSRLM
jgi:hypothetical protein